MTAAEGHTPMTTTVEFDPDREAASEWKRERDARYAEARATRLAAVIPPLFRDAETDNKAALAWIAEPTGTLTLTGPVGSGKSHCGWALIREYMMTKDGLPKVAGWPLAQLLHYLRPGNAPTRTTAPQWDGGIGGTVTIDILGTAQDAALLFLDDVGVERVTDWTAEQVALIVDHRYTHELPTIVASNVLPKDLAGVVGDRIASRWAHNSTVIPVTGADRRRRARS